MSDSDLQQLRDRIRALESENSALKDKLDLIYSIVAPEDDEVQSDEDDPDDLVQIRGVN